MKHRCDSCGGRLGLTIQRWWGYRFCKQICKADFLAKRARQIEQTRRWLSYLKPG
jgi:hypothetical protein